MASAAAVEPVRIAVASAGVDPAEAATALVEARLGQSEGIIVLDRASIQRVMREQDLSVSGVVSADNAVRMGHILNCDVFATIQVNAAEGGKSVRTDLVASVVAFDAATGLRLLDAALCAATADGAERVAESAVEELEGGLRKWWVLGEPDKCRTISILNVRNAGLPPSLRPLAQVIGPLLERDLLARAGFVVLERRRLDWVNREARITEDRRASLLTSAVMLEIDVGCTAAGDTVVLGAFLSDAAGKQLGSVKAEGPAKTPAQAVAALCAKLQEQVGGHGTGQPAAPALTVDRKLEAKRCGAEYWRVRGTLPAEESLQIAESAVALDSESVPLQIALCDALESLVLMLLKRGDAATALDMLDRDLNIHTQWKPADRAIEGADDVPSRRLLLEDTAMEVLRAEKSFPAGERVRLASLRRGLSGAWEVYPASSSFHLRLLIMREEMEAASADAWARGLAKVPMNDLLVREYLMYCYRMLAPVTDPRTSSWGRLYAIEDFTPTGLRGLESFFVRVREAPVQLDLRVQAACSALLLHCRNPELFPETEAARGKALHDIMEFVALAIERGHAHPGLAFIADLGSGRLKYPISPWAVAKEWWQIAERLEAKRLLVPSLLYEMASFGEVCADPGDPPGRFLERVYAQLCNPDMKPVRCGTALSEDGWREDWKRKVAELYQERYGRPIPTGVAVVTRTPEKPTSPWRQIRRVYASGRAPVPHADNRPYLQTAQRIRDDLYLLAYEPATVRPRDYTMLRFSLPELKMETIGSIRTWGIFGFGPTFDHPPDFLVDEKAVYLPEREGFLVYPLDGKPASCWQPPLPAQFATAVTAYDGWMYIACWAQGSEGWLFRCKPDGSNVETLAASARREKTSELDNSAEAWAIVNLIPDPPRRRILFATYASARVWTLDVDTREIRLVRQAPGRHYESGLRRVGPDRVLLSCAHALIRWELASDSFQLVCASVSDAYPTPCVGNSAATFILNSPSPPQLNVWGAAEWQGDIFVADGFFRRWFRFGKQPSVTNDQLPLLDEQVPFFLDTWRGSLIACTGSDIWLIEPAPATPPPAGDVKQP